MAIPSVRGAVFGVVCFVLPLGIGSLRVGVAGSCSRAKCGNTEYCKDALTPKTLCDTHLASVLSEDQRLACNALFPLREESVHSVEAGMCDEWYMLRNSITVNCQRASIPAGLFNKKKGVDCECRCDVIEVLADMNAYKGLLWIGGVAWKTENGKAVRVGGANSSQLTVYGGDHMYFDETSHKPILKDAQPAHVAPFRTHAAPRDAAAP